MFHDELLKEAMSWLGTPYTNYKREKGIEGGVDCLNFIAGVFEKCGALRYMPPKQYDRKFWLRNPYLLMEGVMEALASLTDGTQGSICPSGEIEWREGDALLVKTCPGLSDPNHAVIIANGGGPQTWIIHADSVRGKVLLDVLPSNWEPSRIVRITRA